MYWQDNVRGHAVTYSAHTECSQGVFALFPLHINNNKINELLAGYLVSNTENFF